MSQAVGVFLRPLLIQDRSRVPGADLDLRSYPSRLAIRENKLSHVILSGSSRGWARADNPSATFLRGTTHRLSLHP